MLLPRRLLRLSVLSLLTSYTCRVFLGFTCLYTSAVYFARIRCWRDPTSIFFAEDKAYEPAYSALRAEQANTLLEHLLEHNDSLPHHFQSKASAHPTMCVGIASVAREGVSYLQSAVASVLEGLSATEREALYLIVFIAHTNPAEHPAYSEPWLHALADRVLLYDPGALDIDHIRALETPEEKSGAHEKGLLDYTYLLKACASINASYTVMLEDDVIALDGWYHRTKHALAAIEQQTRKDGADKWLYLRLFYTEEFLGWNSEEWPIYLFYSLLAISGVLAATTAIRRCRPATTTYLPNETIALLSFVITPLLIILFFAAGRVTMLPIPDGVHTMPNFGCCSQGLVFPQARTNDLVSWYESKRAGYVDMLTEEYADQNGDTRWALTPCVLQHVGSKSSKANSPGRPTHGYQRTASETIWNFRFEENGAESLRREHELQKEAEEAMNV